MLCKSPRTAEYRDNTRVECSSLIAMRPDVYFKMLYKFNYTLYNKLHNLNQSVSIHKQTPDNFDLF